MFKLVIYTIYKAIINKKEISRVALCDSVENVTDISGLVVCKKNIKVLALDFDGVLAPHGYNEPVQSVNRWLAKMINNAYLKSIYIYSNKPTESRKLFFEENYPDIKYLYNVLPKPYPNGLCDITTVRNS